MNLANLNIGKRLALGFGVICAMLVCMIVMSTTMLGRINAGTDEIVNNRMPRIEMTGKMLGEIDRIAIAVRNMMLNEEASDRAKQVEAIAAARKDIDGILVELDKTLQNPKGRELLERMKQLTSRYFQGQEQLVKLVNEGLAEESRQYLAEELRPRLAALKKDVEEQAALQKALAMKRPRRPSSPMTIRSA